MALTAVLEADLRALSTEARRKYPAVKDAAEHAILKLRTSADPSQSSRSDDVLKLYFLACETRNVKLTGLGLSCLQKLIAHGAVGPSALPQILSTLQDHSEINDDNLQLKTLQMILTILQSRLHPEDEDSMAILLGLCLRYLGNNRNADSVHSTAAATLRQAVALIFERVVTAEALPAQKLTPSRTSSRSNSVSGVVSRSMMTAKSEENSMRSSVESRDAATQVGRLGLRLLEDLTALAGGGPATWLSVHSLQRTLALDILDYVLSNYISLFKSIKSYQEALRHQICLLLLSSIRATTGVDCEPGFRRIVLKAVANVIRLYSSVVMTECEIFINTLVKSTEAPLPSWHRIMVLEILRGFCVEARILRFLFETFDMQPENTNVVSAMVKSLSRIIVNMQVHDPSEESLGSLSGMFSGRTKDRTEWAPENDSAVLIANEAHTLSLAVEGLLGVIFTVATLTDEAAEAGEVASPRCANPESSVTTISGGQHVELCIAMVKSLWRTLLEALSLMLLRCQDEALVLEIFKGYQAFTQACGVLRLAEPRDAFLASLCKFAFGHAESEKISGGNLNMMSLIPLTPSVLKRGEHATDVREIVILTPKNVQALRTLFNIAHRLDNVLGSSWILVLETLAILDRVIHSPNATTQEVSAVVPRGGSGGSQSSDFNILATLDTQLFESSGTMSTAAVLSLLAGLREVSSSALAAFAAQSSSAGSTGTGAQGLQKMFPVERMMIVLLNNLHRADVLWDDLTSHFLELAGHENPQVRIVALDALDRSVCAVLGCERIHNYDDQQDAFECAVIQPVRTLYDCGRDSEVRLGSLKILLHLLERHADKLQHSWPSIFELLSTVACGSDKDLVPLGFQCLRFLMDDGLISMPSNVMDVCVEVTGAYGRQKVDINVSLTAVGLLWAASDFFARGVNHDFQLNDCQDPESARGKEDVQAGKTLVSGRKDLDSDKLLLAVFCVIQRLSSDERPEVRNSAIRTLFQAVCSHGHKLSCALWEQCLWNFIFPLVQTVRQLAAASSTDESPGKELGMHGGKPVHMLVHHSRNTAQKQWDESLVLVLNGISRLFKPFLHLFQQLPRFKEAWLSTLSFVQDSITEGSREVALAAISALQTIILGHASKGSLTNDYFEATMTVYQNVVYRVCRRNSKVLAKAKQELLQSLGEIYVHGHKLFDTSNYLKLLALIDLILRYLTSASDGPAAARGGISQVERTVLEVLSMVKPLDTGLAHMWPLFFQQLLTYLPGGDRFLCEHCKAAEAGLVKLREQSRKEADKTDSSENTSEEAGWNISLGFSERVVDIIVDLYKPLPYQSKTSILPDIVAAVGRCMLLRRNSPESSIWRTAVKAFNRLLQQEFSGSDEDKARDTYRPHVWKELLEIYETFLVGTCGRALVSPFSETEPETAKADEELDIALLDVLAGDVLSACQDATDDVIARLIDLIDRCAGRTSALSLESVALLPARCARFSLLCLRRLFHVCSYTPAVSKLALPVLVNRCKVIIRQFCIDESLASSTSSNESLVPSARMDELLCVLEELSTLVVRPAAASPGNKATENGSTKVANFQSSEHVHLLLLYGPLCELVIVREQRAREYVRTLLKVVGAELGLIHSDE